MAHTIGGNNAPKLRSTQPLVASQASREKVSEPRGGGGQYQRRRRGLRSYEARPSVPSCCLVSEAGKLACLHHSGLWLLVTPYASALEPGLGAAQAMGALPPCPPRLVRCKHMVIRDLRSPVTYQNVQSTVSFWTSTVAKRQSRCLVTTSTFWQLRTRCTWMCKSTTSTGCQMSTNPHTSHPTSRRSTFVHQSSLAKLFGSRASGMQASALGPGMARNAIVEFGQ